MDAPLRNRLANLLESHYFRRFTSDFDVYVRGWRCFPILAGVWDSVFKRRIRDLSPISSTSIRQVMEAFQECPWHEAYDVLEYLAQDQNKRFPAETERFVDECSKVLAEENSLYRFVGNRLVSIQSTEEREEIERAIDACEPFPGAQKQLIEAMRLMSARVDPNYRKSISESISAVEAVVKHVAGRGATLPDALNKLAPPLNGQLKAGMEKLYYYTSDKNGIRHADMTTAERDSGEAVEQADARYMLITCSAFVNYMKAKYADFNSSRHRRS